MKTIAVVGGGIIGLSVAFRFQCLGGLQTILIDPDDSINASHACQGVVQSKGLRVPREPLFAAKYYGHQSFQKWLRSIISISRQEIPYSFLGIAEPFFNQQDYRTIMERVYHRRWTGLMQYDLQSRIEALSLFGDACAVKRDIAGIIRYPLDGWFDSHLLLQSLKKALRDRGAMYLAEQAYFVDGHGADRFAIATSGGIVEADVCILASGPSTREIADRSALSLPDYQLVPGASFVAPTWKSHPGGYALAYGKHSFRQTGDKAYFGSMSWRQGSDPVLSPENFLDENLPVVDKKWINLDNVEVRIGNRVRMNDRLPYLASLSLGNGNQRVHVATGFYKNGFQLAQGTAEALWNIIHNRPLAYPYSEFYKVS